MKKAFRRIISTVLALILTMSVGVMSFAGNEQTAVKTAATPENNATGFTDDDYLVVQGTDIVNQLGEKIDLKGVNLGAWMIWEDWLGPYEEASDNIEVIEILTERFGVEKAYELLNTYMDNWITEYDLDQIKDMGFNCVRVPFWFRNFYYDDNGTKILDSNGDWDFSRLDWIVSECSKREIYVILDLHGAVGYQSDAPHNGKTDACGLYAQTEQGERYRELTDELWTAIASRFIGNPAVAMYDLLNEPMCDVEGGEISKRINNESIYERLYDTVRKADPDHVITLECIWTAVALPHAFLKGWTNVVYQVHFYNNSNFIFGFFLLLTKLYHPTVPLFVG